MAGRAKYFKAYQRWANNRLEMLQTTMMATVMVMAMMMMMMMMMAIVWAQTA